MSKDGKKTKKTFSEVAAAKGLSEETVKKLEDNEYITAYAVSTLKDEEVAALGLTMAQNGLVRRWVAELTPGASKTAAAATSKQTMIHDLREDASLMELVDRRIKELSLAEDTTDEEEEGGAKGGARPKGKRSSGRKRTSCDVVKREVDWPHFHVYRGPGRTAAEYDTLTLAEFTYGYLNIVWDIMITEEQEKNAMLTHLRLLMADTMEYGWSAARNYHGILLQLIEQGRFNWTADTTKFREQYLKSQPTPIKAPTDRRPQRAAPSDVRYCGPFQTGKCDKESEHESAWGPVQHFCAHCFRRAGKQFPHPECKCMRKGYSAPEKGGDHVDTDFQG